MRPEINRRVLPTSGGKPGLRSPFLDFSYSPRIAGFFASHGGTAGDTGTIICINKSRFNDSWRDINERHQASEGQVLTEILELDVKNLWRLQAQQGLFVRCHVDPSLLEMFSCMLHIYFPQSGSAEVLKEADIYPQEKSHLEVLLDQYFLIEGYPQRLKDAEELFGHVIHASTNEDAKRDQATFFKGQRIPDVHPSWLSDEAEKWLDEPDEKFGHEVRFRTGEITIDDTRYSEETEREIQHKVSRIILDEDQPRRGSISFKILYSNGGEVYISSDGSLVDQDHDWAEYKMSDMIDVIYSGMRGLPYTDKQIARSITRYIMMARYGCYTVIDGTEGVEFEGGGVRGRGFCSRERLLSSLRDDFFSLVSVDRLNARGTMDFRDTFYAAGIDIRSTFVFERFVELFVDDLIPSQAAVAIEGLVIGLNPASIQVFGES